MLPEAHLCITCSLLDGFHCTNWDFASLPTFDLLTALSKMTSKGWKDINREVPYAVSFSPGRPLCVEPHNGQELAGTKGWGASV